MKRLAGLGQFAIARGKEGTYQMPDAFSLQKLPLTASKAFGVWHRLLSPL